MRRAKLFFMLFAFCATYAQEGGTIKFQIPLNLSALSAKDTASFETYSQRLALVKDSISWMQKEIEKVKRNTLSLMPALGPKGEFEKQSEFDARKAKWDKEFADLTEHNTKSLAARLAELERAKKKIEENQVSLYGTIEIKTNPEAASIWLNKEEIGASPAEYKLALPGHTVIRIQKENYEPWDTAFAMQPAQKLKISVTLQEKSIFSKEGEIDFPKILAKDTTVEGYSARKKTVKARIKQIDEEIKVILADFSNAYPALEPQKQGETAQDFEKRKTAWNNEGIRQVGILRSKHEAYKNKLVRSIKVLDDNIIATESLLMNETPLNAQITLGAYDADSEVFEVSVQDTVNVKSPFLFAGRVGIQRDVAKAIAENNRSTAGFIVGVSYINYPFISGDSLFNLAMKELALSRDAVSLKVEGEFKRLGRFEGMKGYGAWRSHADSLLSGALKPQGLDLNYALKGGKAKEAAADVASGGGLGWRGWTRIVAFTGAAVFGTVAIIKHLDAEDYKDKYNAALKDYNAGNLGRYGDLAKNAKGVKDSEDSRTIFGIGAGVFAVGGILTFFF
jgi:hypothetical protein